jgi:hypothetical protein
MAFFPSPPSSPTTPAIFTLQIQQAIDHLDQHNLGKALKAISTIGEGMHHVVSAPWAMGDLRQLSHLFLATVHHSAYGINMQADRVINSLLLQAIRTCEELRATHTPPPYGMVGWLSPAGAEIKDHLETYRNLFGYITNHSTYSRSEDPDLGLAEQLLQRLCPRINGFSRWTAAVGAAKGCARSRKSTTSAQSSTSKPRAKTRKRTSAHPQRRATKPVVVHGAMPTPPTQSGDVNFGGTIPTQLRTPSSMPNAMLPTPDLYPLSHTLREDAIELREVDGWIEEVTQPWAPRLMSPLSGRGQDRRGAMRVSDQKMRRR